ncbi:lipase family protein [Leptothoe spongobia]|uniref:Lipase family protein n=1 Tax=Leptothoe spongobia TAU-MAC 1115 TaxID=1967444 RepID=A0A947DGC6_9CYAN|nr:lipase family protein [Leptothoe spongobia]MBT9316582.1 lipase family protein [Leptothoe spongobia TAU-MAC 1115]
MSSSPMYFPPGFDSEKAIFLNQLVITAYDMYSQWLYQGMQAKNRFGWAPKGPKLAYSEPIWGEDTRFLGIFGRAEPFAFVASTEDNDVYLIFRGTESHSDWSENIKLEQTPYSLAPGYGSVHQGFFSIYETMRDTIHKYLEEIPNPKRLYIAGHSLGSSLSTLAVPDVITNTSYKASLPVIHYNLASPRTGDPDFADAYNANEVETYRVVNTCDVVPTVPLSVTSSKLPLPIYKHVGVPVDFTAQYGEIVENHSVKGAYLYALQHPKQPEENKR